MSKDWTPQEEHRADLMMHFSTSRTTLVLENGEEDIIYDPECEMAKKYPNVYFFKEPFLYELKPETVERLEKTLAAIIEADDKTGLVPEGNDEFEKAVALWYQGKLDPHFYYCTRNDEILLEKLKEL